MEKVIPFAYGEKKVRVIKDENDGLWWVAKDVCEILDHSNYRMAVQGLDEDEKGVSKVYTLGGEQEMLIISESGLYTLILRSNKAEARPFRKWVTSEVLPSIRKTGGYFFREKRSPEYLEELSEAAREMERLDKLFGSAIRIARRMGFDRAYAIVKGNEAVKAATGRDLLKMFGMEIRLEPESLAVFVDECCELGEDCFVRPPLLFQAYQDWCEASGLKPMGKTTFYDQIASQFRVQRYRRHDQTVQEFKGIGLKGFEE